MLVCSMSHVSHHWSPRKSYHVGLIYVDFNYYMIVNVLPKLVDFVQLNYDLKTYDYVYILGT